MLHVHVDYFKWNCANIWEGEGDAYSLNGAASFKKEASVKTCSQVFKPGEKDMRKYIQSVRENCKCLANVVFGKYQDLVSLFVAAHKANYKGEWVVGDSLAGSIDDVVREMSTEHGLSIKEVHGVLQGRCSLNGVKFTDTQ